MLRSNFVLSFLVSISCLLPLIAMGQEEVGEPRTVTVDGIIYWIEDGEAMVTGVESWFIEKAVIPAEVDGAPVTSIGEEAFYSSLILSSVSLPSGITSIGDYAFGYCEKLTTINLPEGLVSIGNEAFVSGLELTNVTLPTTLVELGEGVFYYCPLQATITIPASVSAIGEGAFAGCSSLAEIVVEEGNASFCTEQGVLYNAGKTRLIAYPPSKQDSSFTVPSTVTEIGWGAFANCRTLESLTLPDALDTVPYELCYECASLKEVVISSKVTTISTEAFRRCSSLTEIHLPAGLLYFGVDVFEDCTNLMGISIPDGVTEIRRFLLRNCRNARYVVIGSGVSSIWTSTSAYGVVYHPFSGANLVYAQTDNEFVREWFAEYMPDVQLIGMADELPDMSFSLDDQTVYVLGTTRNLTINSLLVEGEIHYRLDGETPTAADTLYTGPIPLSDTTTVTAQVFVDGVPHGSPITKTYIFRKRVVTPVLSHEMTACVNPGAVVTANCATEGATIRYTTDGSTPTNGSAAFPADGLVITEDTFLTVRAFREDMVGSNNVTSRLYIRQEFTDSGEVFSDGFLSLQSAGNPWFLQTEEVHSTPSALRSGAISHGEATYLEATVSGTGIISFWNRTSSESNYDFFRFCLDGVQMASASGADGWMEYSFLVAEDDTHTFAWTYSKNGSSTFGSDCTWLDDIIWKPATIAAMDGIVFAIADGEATVVDVEDKGIEFAVIPDEADGCPVTAVFHSAFSDCNNLNYIRTDNVHVQEWFAENMPGVRVIGIKEPYDTAIDGLIYHVEKGEATVTGVENKELAEAVILAEVDGVPVTGIGKDAFGKCACLTDVTIPDSVTVIGDGAFASCDSLTDITIPDGVTSIGIAAFQKCASLTGITIPDSVASIGEGAFYSCASLTSIAIPASMTSISDWTFQRCGSLADITIPEGVTTIGNVAFSYCTSLTKVTIPDSVTTIGEWAFEKCGSLTSITIPEGVTSIGKEAFFYCSSLTGIAIPASVTAIGNGAFAYCSSLTGIAIPEGVTDIGDGTFSNCTALTSVTIPDSVTTIGDWAFEKCASLTSVTIPDSVTAFGEGAFVYCIHLTDITVADGNPAFASRDGMLYSADFTTLICCPGGKVEGAFTVPEDVTNIDNGAFAGCIGLTDLTIPEGVTTIGNGAFAGCIAMTSVVIPEGVTTIGEKTFSYCANLTKIVMPDSMTSIGDLAFTHCLALTAITIPEGVTSIGDRAFNACDSLKAVYTDSEYVANWFTEQMPTVKVLPIPEPQAVDYTANEDGMDITGLADGHGEESQLEIPSEIAGLPVVSISDGAFAENEQLVSVSIPDTVVEIGARAFADCPSLEKVVLPASLGHLRDGTFAECKSLGYLLIPDGVKSIGDEETRGEGVGVFSGCSSLATIVIGKGVTSIADNAFDGCEALALIYTDNEAIVPRLIELLGAFINIQPVPTPFRVAIQTEYGLATRSVEPSEELIFGLEAEAVTEPAPPFSPSYNLAFTDGEVALSTDVRVFAESTTWTVTAELSAHSTLTLDWVASAGGEDDTYSMPEEYEFTLTRGEESLDMRNETSILLDNSTGDETRKFSFTITVTHIEEGPTVTCNLAQGWNLIGIPFELDTSSVLKLNQCMTMGFDASVQTYVHSNLEYAPGSGIWLFTEKAASLKLKGTVVEQAPPLEAGWNLVSPLYGEDTLPDGATEIWYWTSGSNQPFQYGDKANPGTGYWFLKK